MIPKVIHYCWFGDIPKGEKEQKCIDSWKKLCPDYEIKEWNESNCDIDSIPFVKQALDCKKYAFASDVIRLWALYNYGGVYLDTDVELIKSYDSLLNCSGFIGFENDEFVNTGQGVGAEKGNAIIKEMFECYNDLSFKPDAVVKCTEINTNILVKYGLKQNGQKQSINGFIVYPQDYFNPYDCMTDRLKTTDNTYSIHWYANSWGTQKNALMKFALKYYHRIQKKFGKL